MNIVSCCPKCAEKLQYTQLMTETGAPKRTGLCQFCMPQRMALLTQYEMIPKHPIRTRAWSGPKRDTRARYRGNWREEEKA